MQRSRRIHLYLLAIVLLAILLVNWHELMRFQREQRFNPLLTSVDLPPTLALTTMAVGPFRGLIANGLWWRAVRMESEGDTFEAIQLANWITKLQPRLSSVWRYQGWNLSFNISVSAQDPAVRWQWVYEGIRLLRDEGLRYNPHNPYLQKELGNIFLNKISIDHDPHNKYFKRRWAELMIRYLPHGTRSDLERLAGSTASEAELRHDPQVQALLVKAEAAGLNLLDFVTLRSRDQWTEAQRRAVPPPDDPVLGRIDAFVSNRALLNDQKLDSTQMLAIDKRFGPFDWRLPEAHAVYWTAPGSYNADEYFTDWDMAFTRQAMEQAFRQGRLVYLDKDTLILGNNLAIIGTLHDYLEYLLQHQWSVDILAKFRGFHEFGIAILYSYGYEAQAREFYADYQKEFTEPRYKGMPFEQFIAEIAPQLLLSDVTSSTDHLAVAYSSLYQAYLALALGDDHRAQGYENLARRTWELNHRKYAAVNPSKLLPPWDKLKEAGLALSMQRLPPELRRALEQRGQGKGSIVIDPQSSLPGLFLGKEHETARENKEHQFKAWSEEGPPPGATRASDVQP